MIISSQTFEAYLKCPTKRYFKAFRETGTGNAYTCVRHVYLLLLNTRIVWEDRSAICLCAKAIATFG